MNLQVLMFKPEQPKIQMYMCPILNLVLFTSVTPN